MSLPQAIIISLFFSLCLLGSFPVKADDGTADKFALHSATLSGNDQRIILTSSWQQMSHPRVSPDLNWLTFTRYNRKKWGIAQETDGYEETEIMVMRLDGSELTTVIPPKPGKLNCNSSWADNGRSLVWVSTDNDDGTPWLMKVELSTRKVTRIPTPKDFKTTDPHIVGDQIVFPVVASLDTLWMMKLDGTQLRQVSFPPDPGGWRWFALPAGDYDPKLSPDGSKIAFMRLQKHDDWRIFVLDLKMNKETNLSGLDNVDIVPDWSSDGELLIFSHLNLSDLKQLGIYIMKNDGSERRMVPLQRRGAINNHPHFYPGAGSGPNAKFVYHSMKVEGLP